MKDATTRICLWSGPRNISTALMYAFAQRADTVVVDEPLYAHYLSHTPARDYHPSAETVLAAQDQDGERVVAEMMGPQPRAVAFYKQMTHHLLSLDRGFLAGVHNVLLTRDPVEMLPSYAAVIPDPTLADVGYALHTELLDYLIARGIEPIVLDAKRVLLDPRGTLTRLCKRVGIPFDEAMLSWSPGARAEDGVWAEHWYASVHASRGFAPYRPKSTPFPPALDPLLAEARPHYERLATMAL